MVVSMTESPKLGVTTGPNINWIYMDSKTIQKPTKIYMD